MTCRTARLGGHLEHCLACGFERHAYNSCRHRHCPKCQTVTKMRWIEARGAELLPTPYVHTVFTLPHEVNPLVLANKRLLLGLLFQSASETLLDFGKRRLGGQLGAIMILHTWDQLLKPHFHVHALVPGGALSHQGQTWNPTKATYLSYQSLEHGLSGQISRRLKRTLRRASAALDRGHLRPRGTPCLQAVRQATVPKEVGCLRQGSLWRP